MKPQAHQTEIITGWKVTNSKTGEVREYKTQRAASNAADKIDNAYGACICNVRAIWGVVDMIGSDAA